MNTRDLFVIEILIKSPRAKIMCVLNIAVFFSRFGERREVPIWIQIISMSLLCIYDLMLFKTISQAKTANHLGQIRKVTHENISGN